MATPILRSAFESTVTGMNCNLRGVHNSRGFFCCCLPMLRLRLLLLPMYRYLLSPLRLFTGRGHACLQVADGWGLPVSVDAAHLLLQLLLFPCCINSECSVHTMSFSIGFSQEAE